MIHEVIEARFRADADLMALLPGDLSFERSNAKLVNRAVFYETDDGTDYRRYYGALTRLYRFVFRLYCESKERADQAVDRMFTVFDGWNSGEFLPGEKRFLQQTPTRGETNQNVVWIAELVYTISQTVVSYGR